MECRHTQKHHHNSESCCCERGTAHHGHQYQSGGFLSKAKRIEALESELKYMKERAADLEAYFAEQRDA